MQNEEAKLVCMLMHSRECKLVFGKMNPVVETDVNSQIFIIQDWSSFIDNQQNKKNFMAITT